ncbi:MAG TPA: acylphosphatase, partial [Candidatus Limnocylindria bacterium]
MTARIIGRVQGVGFRWWIRSHANDLRLTGWVMNDDDERTVSVVAEGTAEALDELERLLWIGPGAAQVDRVQVRREPASGGFDGFAITRP